MSHFELLKNRFDLASHLESRKLTLFDFFDLTSSVDLAFPALSAMLLLAVAIAVSSIRAEAKTYTAEI